MCSVFLFHVCKLMSRRIIIDIHVALVQYVQMLIRPEHFIFCPLQVSCYLQDSVLISFHTHTHFTAMGVGIAQSV
jgi:hypothetical protein